MISEDLVKDAYLKLKNFSYHENLNFFLRNQIAEFEGKKNFERAFTQIAQLLNKSSYKRSRNFNRWLNQIDYKLLPKKIEFGKPPKINNQEGEPGTFISNTRSAEDYTVSNLTYFIFAPIEIHLLDILWIYKAGILLDQELSDDVYGYRLDNQIKTNPQKASSLFKLYIKQYMAYRDEAISSAKNAVEGKNASDVAIFSLDFENYYYSIDLDFEKIKKHLGGLCPNEKDIRDVLKLTNILKEIHAHYKSLIEDNLKISHSHLAHSFIGPLPIGLLSSGILGNWYLKGFDSQILNEIKPIYYGRYVDDVLIVMKNVKVAKQDPIKQFVENYFSEIMSFNKEARKYELNDPERVFVQNEKLVLHFFEKSQSIAGLRLFKKKIEQNNSAFRFLPGSNVEKELDEFAYDLLYDGSSNKIRSITGVSENATELSKYLSLHIIAHRLSETDTSQMIIDQLFKFFQGKNYLDFCRLWEKVFSFAIIKGKHDAAYDFFGRADNIFMSIKHFNFDNDQSSLQKDLRKKILESLREYLEISLAMACALIDLSSEKTSGVKRFEKLIKAESDFTDGSIYEKALKIRKANMMRHNYVAYPLANYTEYHGSLLNADFYEPFKSKSKLKLSQNLIEYTPRFIHLDELFLFYFIRSQIGKKWDNKWRDKAIEKYKEIHGMDKKSQIPELIPRSRCYIEDDDCIDADRTDFPSTGEKEEKLKVAIANIIVSETDIENSYRRDRSPNISFDRQTNIYNILNACEQEKVDMLILPEVSIPHHWLPFMVSHSRRHQIGLVFGVEHWVIGNKVYNFIATSLPYKYKNIYNTCFLSLRIKNHYAPQERRDLETVHLQPVEPNPAYYEMFVWKGIQFASYNCFELANLSHRALFKSDLDLLVACVWNKDINYYEKIMESVVRDLHCYVAQANTSDYGGSCVLQPKKTEEVHIIKVKGGENCTILTATLDIKKLREFQFKGYSETDKTFKPTPPGFDHQKVLRRGK